MKKKDLQEKELRSKIMRSVKSKNTRTEILVRKMVRELGFYYRLNVQSLPGKPDIVIRKLKKVIFVNGCFWHGHRCSKGRLPKSNIEFWQTKVENNKRRDKKVRKELIQSGWECLVIWQCSTKDIDKTKKALADFLSNK